MPYNNAPISPPEEVTGSSSLPLARVKKIIQQDDDIAQTSNSAAFAISVATEVFIRYLTDQAYNVVKSERKPRRNIAYKDVATAISRIDNLEFLSDVVPKTKTYRQFKEEKAREEASSAAGPDTGRPGSSSNGVGGGINGEVGPTSGSGSKGIRHMLQDQASKTNGVNGHGRGRSHAHTHSDSSIPHSPMADRTLGHGHPDPVRDLDVDMTG